MPTKRKVTRKPAGKPQEFPQFYAPVEAQERHPAWHQLVTAYKTEIDIQIGKHEAHIIEDCRNQIIERATIYFKEGKDLQASLLREIASELSEDAVRRYHHALSMQGAGQDWIIKSAFDMLTPAQLDRLGSMFPVTKSH